MTQTALAGRQDISNKTISEGGGESLPPYKEALNSQDAGPTRTAHMCVSVLLDYPGEDYDQDLSVIALELENLDDKVAAELAEYLSWAQKTDVGDIEKAYVDTFDKRRKCALHLTYYSTGDTRLRGGALVTFGQAFEAMGWRIEGGELPDYLPAVCELAARTGDELALHLLNVHREGLEVLRAALESLNSPWAAVMRALILTLPPLDERAKDAYQRLIMKGPPAEMVGITDLPFPMMSGVES
ncbi:MAG: nitrate reductase molybdenum cofactor assembly chaperone [Actinomycetaceae bacterium]|nr:nitrate reductase molybdenum cofactor assembly chaperone [Actinomycetaceae bacterium]